VASELAELKQKGRLPESSEVKGDGDGFSDSSQIYFKMYFERKSESESNSGNDSESSSGDNSDSNSDKRIESNSSESDSDSVNEAEKQSSIYVRRLVSTIEDALSKNEIEEINAEEYYNNTEKLNDISTDQKDEKNLYRDRHIKVAVESRDNFITALEQSVTLNSKFIDIYYLEEDGENIFYMKLYGEKGGEKANTALYQGLIEKLNEDPEYDMGIGDIKVEEIDEQTYSGVIDDAEQQELTNRVRNLGITFDELKQKDIDDAKERLKKLAKGNEPGGLRGAFDKSVKNKLNDAKSFKDLGDIIKPISKKVKGDIPNRLKNLSKIYDDYDTIDYKFARERSKNMLKGMHTVVPPNYVDPAYESISFDNAYMLSEDVAYGDKVVSDIKNAGQYLSNLMEDYLSYTRDEAEKRADEAVQNIENKEVEIKELIQIGKVLVKLIENSVISSEYAEELKARVRKVASDSFDQGTIEDAINAIVKQAIEESVQAFENNFDPGSPEELDSVYKSKVEDIREVEELEIINSDESQSFIERLEAAYNSKRGKFYEAHGYSEGITYEKIFTLVIDKEVTVKFEEEEGDENKGAEDVPNWLRGALELAGYDPEPGAQAVINQYKHVRKAAWDWSGDGIFRKQNKEKASGEFAEFRRKIANFMMESIGPAVGGGMSGGTGMDMGGVGSGGGNTPGLTHQVPGSVPGMGNITMPDSQGNEGSGDIPMGSRKKNNTKRKKKKKQKVKSTKRNKKYTNSNNNTFNFQDFLKVKNQYNNG
jgi:hypothetical protein